MTDFLIGTGGWAYFNVPEMHPLEAYSKAFSFVEVNSTFYEIPEMSLVKSWRRIVPSEFQFSVRCNKRLTHELKFQSTPEAFQVFDEMVRICKTLETKFLHFQTPPSFKYNKANIEKIKNFFTSTNHDNIRIALETRNSAPFDQNFVKMFKDLDIIHCVDLLKGQKPAYVNDVLYTRLFGKGPHNIYQPLDSELRHMDQTISKSGVKKAIVTSHSVRMFKDAARFKIFKDTGKFPQVTHSTGIDSLVEVLREDARFPSSKTALLDHQGWKVIDLTANKRVHASELLQSLPEKTYYGINDIVKVLGEQRIG